MEKFTVFGKPIGSHYGGTGGHFFMLLLTWCYNTIYVVDSLDRDRIGKAKIEFQAIINDPFMRNSVILVFANKQDMSQDIVKDSELSTTSKESGQATLYRGAMTPMEVCEGLGLFDLKNRKWHIQGTCALRGDGLYEGLDWLASTLKEVRAAGYSSVGTSI
ncbi:ADP-ribosylation factor [Bienertia sinuspersici]